MQSTGRHAEGTAVWFNKKKKGQRSYYPFIVAGLGGSCLAGAARIARDANGGATVRDPWR